MTVVVLFNIDVGVFTIAVDLHMARVVVVAVAAAAATAAPPLCIKLCLHP
jgi:hypothetical protein